MRGRKPNENFKKQVLALYITCLNYHEVARLTGISVNGVKSIVRKEQKNNPREYAQLSTKILKKNDNKINSTIFNLMDLYVDSGTSLLDRPFMLQSLMNRQDKLYYERQKELYKAKERALIYECRRLEKAILLRDSKELLNLIKESKNDNKLYEPLDMDFLVSEARYSVGDFYNEQPKINEKLKGKYNEDIKRFLIDRGYKLENGTNNKRFN